MSSISNLAGITIHAHLVDLQSGLIVQTAKITAPTTEDASRQLPVLAAQLMMNDEEKLAYERRLQMYQPPAVVDVNRIVNSGVPFYQPGAVVQPVMFTASRPPALGNLRVEDFDRLPVFQSNPLPPSAILLESSRPLRGRLLALQLELGDNFFRRGLHREALVRFQFARELDPANVNILSRINSCQQYIPAGFANPVGFVPRRERLASLNFFVAGDNRQVPPELSTWLPDQLGPYFSPTFEVLDRSEVYWMMGRLGLTLGDVLQDALVRRWLGRALDVRYLLVGRVQLLNGIVVTTSLLDVEQGWEIGRGQVVVPSVLDIKPYLPELARWTLLNPAERQRLELEAAAWEAEYLRAQEAARRGQWEIALNLGRSLQRKQPLNIRIGLFLNDCEGRARLATLEATRQYELERQRQLVLAAQRRQAELLLQAERARQAALERAAVLAAAERQRQRDLAHNQLLGQARLAIQGRNFSIALELYESALAFRPQDEVILREVAEARMRYEEDRRLAWMREQARQEEARRREELSRISQAQQILTQERQRQERETQLALEYQRKVDQDEIQRLLQLADQLQSQGRLDQAAAALQSALRLQRSDLTERKLQAVLMEHARLEAKAHDAARLAELEKQLAQETARRKQAEEQAKANKAQYDAALALAVEAQKKRNYTVAVAKYQEAGKLFQTAEVMDGLRQVHLAQAEEAKLQEREKAENEAKTRQAEAIAQLLQNARRYEQTRNYDEAWKLLQQAREQAPTHAEVLLALTRVEKARMRAVHAAEQDTKKQKEFILSQARSRAKARQYEAALKLLEGISGDAQVDALTAEIKKQQHQELQDIALAKQRAEESRQQAALRLEEEEKAKLAAAQAKQSVEEALRKGDLSAAASALAEARKLAPRDPALARLGQELAQAQMQAVREKTQMDARAKLEAEAQARLAAMKKVEQSKINELLTKAREAIVQKNFSDAEKLIAEALSLDSTNLSGARLQRELREVRQAEAQAKTAMSAAERKKREEEKARNKVEFNRLMKEGKEALATEDMDKAIELFT
ncbi:MAG TPA: hypothetical protein PKA06_04505, partial [Gemmatales bacterium]|nr:hypothetical protein [Gemmatales bacterium]